MTAKLPEAIFWLADATLSKVRNNQLELKKGAKDAARGGTISRVQEALVYWGQRRQPPLALLPVYGADGHFGNETKDALVAFQKANKDAQGSQLVPDGILGDLTLGALDRIVTAPAPVAPTAPPNLPPATDNDWIKFSVDVFIFADGPEKQYVNKVFSIANEVFAPIRLTARLGRFWHPYEGGQMALLNEMASFVFDVNQRGGARAGGASSQISVVTAAGKGMTGELARLHTRTLPGRITACFVNQFPVAAMKYIGVCFTQRMVGRPTVIIPKSTNCAEVFWHELGHALLNTDYNHEDHDSKTIMHKTPSRAARSLPFSPYQRQAMRATARTLS